MTPITLLKNGYSWLYRTLRLLKGEFVIIFLNKKPLYNKKFGFSICAIFKNEASYLKEWIEFNNMIGFEHFYLYNNYSDDNYKEVLEPYLESGLVTLIEFPYEQGQIKAYKHFYENFRHQTQWVSFLDIDEFYCPISHNNIKEWIKQYEKYPVVQIYWKMFGTSGLMHHDPNKLLIEQYHVSWDGLYHCGKCIVNTDYNMSDYDSATIHGTCVRYSIFGITFRIHPYNIFHRATLHEGDWLFRYGESRKPSIQINHYWSKAWDCYDSKRKKSDVFYKNNPKQKLEYFLWHERQNCSVDYNIYKYVMQFKLRINNIK